MDRRSFIKCLGILPCYIPIDRTVSDKPPTQQEEDAPFWCNEGPILTAWFSGNFWLAKGNIVRWSNKHILDTKMPLPFNGYEWNILPTINICKLLYPDKNKLIWCGEYSEVWEISRIDDSTIPFRFQRTS